MKKSTKNISSAEMQAVLDKAKREENYTTKLLREQGKLDIDLEEGKITREEYRKKLSAISEKVKKEKEKKDAEARKKVRQQKKTVSKRVRQVSVTEDELNALKIAAVDFATAAETNADGVKRAEIKKAEGVRQAKILEAEGDAQAIKLVNEAAEKYFIGNAQLLRKLQAMENALKNNAKIVLPTDSELVNVIGDMSGVLPLKREQKE